MSKQCPACGATVSDTAKFCRFCGTKIVTVQVVYCPECGAKCTADDSFCEECGFDLREDAPPVAEAPAPVAEAPAPAKKSSAPKKKAAGKPTTPKTQAPAIEKASQSSEDEWGDLAEAFSGAGNGDDEWGTATADSSHASVRKAETSDLHTALPTADDRKDSDDWDDSEDWEDSDDLDDSDDWDDSDEWEDDTSAKASAPAAKGVDADNSSAGKSGTVDEWEIEKTLASYTDYEERDAYESFEYKKTPGGDIVIVRFLDEYAMEAIVPKGAAVIGDMAFAGCNAITVTLPEGIHTIGKRAFAGCTNLEKLNIPRSVRMIGDEAFSGATRLEVTLPSGARVGENALRGTVNEKKAQQAKEAEITRQYEEAVALYDKGEYAKALPLLLSFQKDEDSAHLERIAYCYQNANRWTEAFSYYQRASSMGNQWAQYRLAQCYRWGNGCDKNLHTSFTLFKNAAMQNHVWSQVELSECYKYGSGCDKNLNEAFKWAKKAAEAGDTAARLYCGEYYYWGNGVEKNYAEAFKWFTLSANGGNAHARYLLGECYKYGQGTGRDPSAAKKWYEAADQQGNIYAQHALGCMYRDGDGIPRDAQKAVELFRRSASGGRCFAMYDLAECLRKGEGVAVNKAEALTWYRKAAENGNAWHMARLAEIYRGGHCDVTDPSEVLKWYQKAADHGNTWSLVALGDCHRDGIGCVKDEKKATEWYKKAADAGESWGQYQYGYRLFGAIGCDRNVEMAVSYLSTVAMSSSPANAWAADHLQWRMLSGADCEKKPPEAFKWAKRRAECKRDGYGLCLLGSYYAYGWGTPVNEAEAFRQYLAAADEFDYAEAQYNVGEYYLHGKGGQAVNKIKAIEWFMKAASKGQEKAKEVLNGLQ